MPTADEQFLTSLLLAQGRTGEAAQLELEATPSARREDEAQKPTKRALGLPRGSQRRGEKTFGLGRPRPLDSQTKKRIMEWAECLLEPTKKGRAYGEMTPKTLKVLKSILWGNHNAKTGFCFPGYERIAAPAGCGRVTVWRAIRRLEASGIMSWVNRLKRVQERCSDLLGDNGWRWRVLRTSNAYHFNSPKPVHTPSKPSPSKFQMGTGTPNQGLPATKFESPLASGPTRPLGRTSSSHENIRNNRSFAAAGEPANGGLCAADKATAEKLKAKT